MAFTAKRIYRGLNGAELKEILPQRVREAMSLDNTVNVARGFPLLRYTVRIELIPYRSAGQDRAGLEQLAPDKSIVYECDGEYFVPVETEALALEEESPIYGKEADPQELRTLAGLGTVESIRTNTGELVDVRTKPGEKPNAPAVRIPDEAAPLPAPAAPFDPNEDAKKTYEIEEQRWRASHPDDGIEKAIRDASFDPAGALKSAPGRVSIVGSGGIYRGRR